MRAFFLFFVALLFLPIMLQVVLWIVSRSSQATHALKKTCEEQIYWNLYLRFGLEGFLELSLVSLCRIKAASLAAKDDIILTAFAFLIYSVLVFFMLYSGIFLH